MKRVLTPRRTAALLLGLGVAVPAAGQSLGNPRAEAWIGQPLQLNVPVRFASASPDDECVQAQVFYGDRRVAEVWTFERTLGASDPNWLLARTEPAAA